MKSNSAISESRLIIAIDGPAGSGKSTTAQLLAEKLNYLYLDTGALYRAFTLKVVKTGLGKGQEGEIVALLNHTEIDLKNDSGTLRVLLDKEDVTDKIRTPEIDREVTWVCQIPEVRTQLVELQRQYGRHGKVIAEGRDIGTVVFPNADMKFYLIATLKARSKRRQRDLQRQSIDLPFESIRSEIAQRDKLDSERELSPLVKADDAIEIDTTNLAIEEQVELLYTKVLEHVDHMRKSDAGL